jgi:hypothetical protein
MDKGKIMEKGTHEELLRIPIEKSASGKMLKGWYHDLWATQMGNDDSHRLDYLERRVKLLETQNARLLTDPLKGYKLGRAKRSDASVPAVPPMTFLKKSNSATTPESRNEEELSAEAVPFEPLILERARTNPGS